MWFAKSRFIGWGLVAAAGLLGSVAAQANLVTNGGFDAGNFDGWTVTDSIYVVVDSLTPKDGAYAALLATPDASQISQTLNTEAGSKYNVSFYLRNDADFPGAVAPNSFVFEWGGTPAALELTDADPFGYRLYEFELTANSDQTDISFTFFQEFGFWDLDSVVVEAIDAPAGVPEPGSFALLGLASALALAATRRRRVAAVA